MTTNLPNLLDACARPTAYDSRANLALRVPEDDLALWLVVIGRNRDSGVLTNCNFEVAREQLDAIAAPIPELAATSDGDTDPVRVHSFGHWACGWIEYLCVRADSPAHVAAGELIAAKLADYPILDESKYAEAEQNAANEIWRDCYRPADRVAYIREHRRQFEFHDWADLRAQVRGEYFGGYACELIG